MKNVQTEVSYANCCGCGACYNTCSKGAISMQHNKEGFLVPVVEEEKCIDCGLCLKACPALNEKRKNNESPECYAAQAQDSIRAASSSGGVFTPLAEEIINRGGYVCGAAFADDWSVQHIIIDNKEDLAKLRGSKYVQSNTGKCYSEIRKLLRADNWVLFSGTPCQVAGLYTFLGKKEYEKLITVDIFCHGAPSPGVWKRYLNENYEKGSIATINFRDKTAIGWSCSHVTITTTNGDRKVSNDYTKWFHRSIILRPSCGNCPYSRLPRPADISLGDWWGISSIAPSLNDGKGLSNVLLNSEKGRKLFEVIRPDIKAHKLTLPPTYNNGHLRKGMTLSPDRARYFANAQNRNFQTTAAIMEGNCDLCYVSIFYGTNYGTMLVSYAVYKLLEKTGLSILVLDRPKMIWPNGRVGHRIPYTFARKHYTNISRCYENVADLARLNDMCKAFIVGSDQLFLPGLNLDSLALLPFVRTDRRKISYATSFGKDSYDAPLERLLRNKENLKRFDHVSLREYPPHLMRNVFEMDAEEVMEPTLCIPREHYSQLADTAEELELKEQYLLTYLLDPTEEKEKAISHIATKLGLKVVYIRNIAVPNVKYAGSQLKGERDYSPEQFLKLYRGSSFVVTDSFHGTCFAVKFGKPFVSLINVGRGALRYKLFDKMKLTHRMYKTPADVFSTENWMQAVDFEPAEQFMKEEAARSAEWLISALEGIVDRDKVSPSVLPPHPLPTEAKAEKTFSPPVTDFSLSPFTNSAPAQKKKNRKGLNKVAHDCAHGIRDVIRQLRGKHKKK